MEKCGAGRGSGSALRDADERAGRQGDDRGGEGIEEPGMNLGNG